MTLRERMKLTDGYFEEIRLLQVQKKGATPEDIGLLSLRIENLKSLINQNERELACYTSPTWTNY